MTPYGRVGLARTIQRTLVRVDQLSPSHTSATNVGQAEHRACRSDRPKPPRINRLRCRRTEARYLRRSSWRCAGNCSPLAIILISAPEAMLGALPVSELDSPRAPDTRSGGLTDHHLSAGESPGPWHGLAARVERSRGLEGHATGPQPAPTLPSGRQAQRSHRNRPQKE